MDVAKFLSVVCFLGFASKASCLGTFFQKVSENENDEDNLVVPTKGFHQCSLENICKYVGISTDNKIYKAATRQQLGKLNKKLQIWKKVEISDFNSDASNLQQAFNSCKEAMEGGQHQNGIIELSWVNGSKLHVYCDMVTDGGGWTVFQRRLNNSVSFQRDWKAYENGFGDLNSSFWLGLKALHFLTSNGNTTLRFDLQADDGDRGYAKYTNFKIGSPEEKYKITFDNYSGNIGDAMKRSNEMAFSTYDQDNDIWLDSCAREYQGGWWYFSCLDCNLNNWYPGSRLTTSTPPKADLMSWSLWKLNHMGNIIFSEMKLKKEN